MPIPGLLPGLTSYAPGTPLQGRLVTIGGDYDDTQLTLGAVDDLGSRLYLNDLEGWDGAIGTTIAISQRPNADGAYYTDPYLPARVMAASVQVIAPSRAVLLESLKLIAHRVPLRSTRAMIVTEGEQQLTSDVIQSGDLLADDKAHTARVSIPLTATDPRRYAVDTTVVSTGLPVTVGGLRLPTRLPARIQAVVRPGILNVTNTGNVDTPAVLTVTGPCPPFAITHVATARTLRFHDAVPAGRTVVLDTDAQTALVDGTEPRYVTGTWFDYLPGANQVAFTAASYDAGAQLTSRHRNAWK